MERTITIADAHSQNKPKHSFVLEMTGGSPWYAHVWIEDQGYTIYKNDDSDEISIELQEDSFAI